MTTDVNVIESVVEVLTEGPQGVPGTGAGGGAMPINQGGTGATTAAGARANLGVDAAGTATSAAAAAVGAHATASDPHGDRAYADAQLAGKVPTTRTVNGHALTADVTLGKSDVGLSNVDNTADANKPVSTDQAAADTAALNAAKAYADSLVVGLLDDRGNYDASGNVWPSSGGSGTAGAILKGDLWRISVAGALGGVAVTPGDQIRALTDAPGQTAGNWATVEANLGFVPENSASKDASGGYAGLSGFALKIKNAAGSVVSLMSSAATSARTWVMPDKDGTVAMTSDIPGSTDSLSEGATNQYFTAARVRAAVLTGLSTAVSAAITAADTVLSALGKLQAQIGGKQDALVSGSNIKTVNGSSILGSGDLTVGGSSFDPASPGAIGGTTPAAVTGTTITATAGVVAGASQSFTFSGSNIGLFALNSYMWGLKNNGLYRLTSSLGSSDRLWCRGIDFGAGEYYNASSATLSGPTAGQLDVTDGSGSFRDLKLRTLIATGRVDLPQYTTATRPAHVNGAAIFDADLDKLLIGGASSWEVVSST